MPWLNRGANTKPAINLAALLEAVRRPVLALNAKPGSRFEPSVDSATVDETKRAVAFMRQLAREVRGDQPSMMIEEHIRATYGQRRDVGLSETPEARPGLKRDARRTLPAARGILRGDRRREAADDQG